MHYREPSKSGDYSLGNVHEFIGAFGRAGGSPALLQLALENKLVMNRLIECWRASGTGYLFTDPERRAYDIFGQERFIHAGLTRSAWGTPSLINSEIRYSEETLLRCAIENKSGDQTTDFEYGRDQRPTERRWHLVYLAGYSFQDVLDTYEKWAPMASDFGSERFSTTRMEPGYYLINYRTLCGSNGEKDRRVQDDFLAALGPQYERVPVGMLCETAVTLCHSFGGRAASMYPAHWGHEICENLRFLSVEIEAEHTGHPFSTNIRIRLAAEHQGTGKYGSGAGVCFYRKHDF